MTRTPNARDAASLEAIIREMTRPIEGQYPRPWMTNLTDPTSATVFTVGMNQAKKFDASQVGDHDRYMDALFNRGAESCRGLYDRLSGGPSPTRQNTDRLVKNLEERGVHSVLETNVVCYSTPMSADLRQTVHIKGASKGQEIFRLLLDIIQPKVLIAHGAGTAKKLGAVLGLDLPPPPNQIAQPQPIDVAGLSVFVIPSLAPPAYNMWAAWSHEYLSELAQRVEKCLTRENSAKSVLF